MRALEALKGIREERRNRYVFDRATDNTLRRLGRQARAALEGTPPGRRPRILYLPGYLHSKYVGLYDATIVLALQLRGAEVIPLVSDMFYREEDVVFGGAYNSNRFDNQYAYAREESRIFGSLLSTAPISLTAASTSDHERRALEISGSASWRPDDMLHHEGLPAGHMAAQAVANMNNIPAMTASAEHLRQWRHHLYNILRLAAAFRAILGTVRPERIVSNIPFYYKWRVPFEIARPLGIPFYSYMLAERKNALAWNLNSHDFFDASACWESFRDSDVYAQNEHLVVQGIEERKHGRTSHLKFLPKHSGNTPEAGRIRAAVAGRPAVLFPANVLVDAAVLMPTPAFSSCMEMIRAVIEFFRAHPQFACVLKAHPAEKLWASSGTSIELMHLKDALRDQGISLPENVIFVDFDTTVSSFELYGAARGLIAYTSSTAMEIGWLGKTAITAQRAHYSCAGFSKCPQTRAEFFEQLESVLTDPKGDAPNQEVQRLARIYYLLYNRVTQVDMGLVQGNDLGTIPAALLYDGLPALAPGANAALDYVCDAILTGKPIFGPGRWPPVT